MDQPVIVKYKWTAEDLLEAYRCHECHTCRPVFRIAINVTIVLVMLVGAVGCWIGIKSSRGFDSLMCLGLVIGGVYWFAIWPFHRRWLVRRQFARRPDNDVDIEWDIRPDLISTRSRLGHSQFTWEAIVKVVRTPSGILLYSLDPLFHWLPGRGFETIADFEKLTQMAKTNVQKFYQIT